MKVKQLSRMTTQGQWEHDKLTQQAESAHWGRRILHFLLSLVSLILASWLVFGVLFGVAYIHGDGILSTSSVNSIVLYLRGDRGWETGDFVLYRVGGEKLAGTVAAVGGDELFCEDGQLTLRGSVLCPCEQTELTYPYTVPDGYVFLLWDGADSRTLGAVPESTLIGEVKGRWSI